MDIELLIRTWADAVHSGDLDTVLADHADDIVMFDVPPPHDGVRGIEEYRETWPPFFGWQASGASFEIVELDVTAGDDVAFAWALLQCGTADELAEEPRPPAAAHDRAAQAGRPVGGRPRAPLVRRHVGFRLSRLLIAAFSHTSGRSGRRA